METDNKEDHISIMDKTNLKYYYGQEMIFELKISLGEFRFSDDKLQKRIGHWMIIR